DRNRSHWSTSKTPSYTKSVSWQHHLSQECIDKLDIFFADDLFKYESVCIAAMEHLKSKATAPIQNGPLPA
ncbi:hypothetical protein OU569_20655, partial [Escherichia coli]|nr:hypothetical protein [Escherichia coli]MDF8412555.1 hypothetical protein [Escherichia coli]MDF8761606.1 hypothetical protein [Escherichia coli]MDF8790362.1 hypothetical protein [Escherichia coli]